MKAVIALLVLANAVLVLGTCVSTQQTQERIAAIEQKMNSDGHIQSEADKLANRLVPVIEKSLSPLMEAPAAGETHAEALFDRILPMLTDYVARSKEPQQAEESMPLEYHTKADADRLAEAARAKGSPEALADCLATVDQWIAKPEDEKELQDFKLKLVVELRKAIVAAVKDRHKQCLHTETGAAAATLYGEAGQLIALYPLSEDEGVIDQARSLTSSHGEVGAKIEVLRRQRYNSWALERIAEHLAWLEKHRSSWSTKDNPKVVDETATALGPIDPNLLEPVVAQLYGMAVSQANEAINTTQKSFMAEKMLDPRIAKRKTFGDF